VGCVQLCRVAGNKVIPYDTGLFLALRWVSREELYSFLKLTGKSNVLTFTPLHKSLFRIFVRYTHNKWTQVEFRSFTKGVLIHLSL